MKGYDVPIELVQAARSSKTDPTQLEALSMSIWEDVRLNVASNPKTPPRILAVLADEPHINIRSRVAGNKNTPIETLRILRRDHEAMVRWKSLMNGAVSKKEIELAAKDSSMDVRYVVAQIDHTPIEILISLTKDDSKTVSRHAKENLQRRSILDELLDP